VTDNVVALPGFQVPENGAVPDVVQQLEEMLERARAGHIKGIAMATVHHDGLAGTAWAGESQFRLGGALLMLQHRFARHLLGIE
jgi:hypothetical protein